MHSSQACPQPERQAAAAPASMSLTGHLAGLEAAGERLFATLRGLSATQRRLLVPAFDHVNEARAAAGRAGHAFDPIASIAGNVMRVACDQLTLDEDNPAWCELFEASHELIAADVTYVCSGRR